MTTQTEGATPSIPTSSSISPPPAPCVGPSYSTSGNTHDQQPPDRARRRSSRSSRPRCATRRPGRPSLAFVAGESGVGKSRMLAEFARRTRDDGARVAIGDCVELGEEELPYAPIVERPALARARRRRRPRDAPPGVRAELATLLPELGGGAWPAGRAAAANETPLGQPRLFEALLTLLDHLGREQPFALVLEDIHWADRSTRAFLVFLGRSLWTERVLVIATYRSDELHRRHPLRPLLAELERDTARAPDRADPADARRARRPARRHPRRRRPTTSSSSASTPAARATRCSPRSCSPPRLDGRGGAADDAARRADGPDRAPERAGAGGAARCCPPARVVSHDVLADASGLGGAELRDGVREAAESQRDRRRRARPLPVPPRAAARGRPRRPAARRARRAAPRAGARARGAGRRDRRRRDHHRGHRPPLPLRRLPARGARRVGARRRRGRARPRPRRGGRAARARARPVVARARRDGAGRLRPRRAAAPRGPGADQRRRPRARRGAARRRVAEVDEEQRARAAPPACSSCSSRAQWSLGRAEDARDASPAPSTLLPEDDREPRARTDPRAAGEDRDAPGPLQRGAAGRRARRSTPRAARAPTAARPTRSTRWASRSSCSARSRRARQPARGDRDLPPRLRAHQRLGQPGRRAAPRRAARSEALAVAEQGLADTAGAGRGSDWLTMTLGDIRWDLGDWDGRAPAPAAARPPPRRDRRSPTSRLLRADDRARRRRPRRGRAPRSTASRDSSQGSREPQFIGWYGALRGELERRGGDLAAARAAVDDGLDAIEFCSEDLPRIARLSETGAAIEADAAQRARDLGDADGRARRRSRAPRAS